MSSLKPAGRARRGPPSDGQDSDLAASIQRHGQLQPIIARPDGEVLIGERRRRVLEQIGVDPEVRTVDTDEAEALAIRLSEEFSKSDMTVVERAEGVRELIGILKDRGEKITYRRLGELIGTTEAAIKNYIALSELPDAVKQMVQVGIQQADGTITKLGAKSARVLATELGAKPKGTRGTLSGNQLVAVAKKITEGKAPSGNATSKVAQFVREAPPKARKAFLDNPSVTFEDAQRYAVRERDEARRAEEAERVAIDTAGLFFAEFTTRIRSWVTGLQGIMEHVPVCPPDRRADLTVWLSQLIKASEKMLDILDAPEEEPTLKQAQVIRGLLNE